MIYATIAYVWVEQHHKIGAVNLGTAKSEPRLVAPFQMA